MLSGESVGDVGRSRERSEAPQQPAFPITAWSSPFAPANLAGGGWPGGREQIGLMAAEPKPGGQYKFFFQKISTFRSC